MVALRLHDKTRITEAARKISQTSGNTKEYEDEEN